MQTKGGATKLHEVERSTIHVPSRVQTIQFFPSCDDVDWYKAANGDWEGSADGGVVFSCSEMVVGWDAARVKPVLEVPQFHSDIVYGVQSYRNVLWLVSLDKHVSVWRNAKR